jgi:hypothetical protein
MFKCCSTDAYLVVLVPDSSLVLQPLGVAAFVPVENEDRQEISKLAGLADYRTLGNVTFL